MKTKITNIGAFATWSEKDQKVVTSSSKEILIENGFIVEIAKKVKKADNEVNANRAFITPGFIDSHTHPVFCGDRASEFKMRLAGKSYSEIAQAGGGIISSIKGVRQSDENMLFSESYNRMDGFLKNGTTTIEAKSGYGLNLNDELKMLRIIKRLNEESELDIIPTFLGAHAFPPEFADDHDGYVNLICDEIIPAVVENELAEYCDVFCEIGYFTVEQSRKILETAKKYGLKPRLHADEFVNSGAAELASEVGAVSADHLMAVSDDGIEAMAKNNVIATLLPGTTLFLGNHIYAPGRKIIDAGCEVAIATDFNPGSSTLQSLTIAMSLAVLHCGLTIEEAFKGVTYIAAKSLNREDRIGCVQIGYQADLLFWNLNSLEEIPYWLGNNQITKILKKGIEVT
ncbi:MAG: imidazolonepropionase [Candidatus Marinimicrobia bacterium]|nr:imidazolonepropionase [Candidatus Neomarinimicrobiota bacterium]MBL7023080.1 imidazolonepropionase [Candidatus Neomarinimicrobiota bacterium]MBL7109100.1 imidazolonepropionase [Candidatus Neomarinimicrobiota bacterium]